MFKGNEIEVGSIGWVSQVKEVGYCSLFFLAFVAVVGGWFLL